MLMCPTLAHALLSSYAEELCIFCLRILTKFLYELEVCIVYIFSLLFFCVNVVHVCAVARAHQIINVSSNGVASTDGRLS